MTNRILKQVLKPAFIDLLAKHNRATLAFRVVLLAVWWMSNIQFPLCFGLYFWGKGVLCHYLVANHLLFGARCTYCTVVFFSEHSCLLHLEVLIRAGRAHRKVTGCQAKLWAKKDAKRFLLSWGQLQSLVIMLFWVCHYERPRSQYASSSDPLSTYRYWLEQL